MTTYHSNGQPGSDAGAQEQSFGEKVQERIHDNLDAAREAGASATRQASDFAQSARDDSARFVRDNPGIALAGAVGLGVLIGLSLRGR